MFKVKHFITFPLKCLSQCLNVTPAALRIVDIEVPGKSTCCATAQGSASSFFLYPGEAICYQNILPPNGICYWCLTAIGKCRYWGISGARVLLSQTSLLVQISELMTGALLSKAFDNWALAFASSHSGAKKSMFV